MASSSGRQMADGLKSLAGWSVAASAIVRKEISACRIRRIRGAPQAMTLAENIVKFVFKAGDKIR